MSIYKTLIASVAACVAGITQAAEYNLPPADIDVVGMVQQVTTKPNQDLLDIGRSFGIGVEAMKNANPKLDMWNPGAGTKVLIPSRYILPNVPRRGIVINLPEMRLYYYPPNKNVVYVYAVGIGREDWSTPTRQLDVIQKIPNPTWTPPASIRKEHAAKGDPLPAVWPAGPNNPLGLFAMRLSDPSYLIHGTNKPWGVGMRVSHGCVRLYPEAIEELFKMVPKGTPVNIIKEPMKVGWYGDQLYLEYHPPLAESKVSAEQAMQNALDVVHKMAAERGLHVKDALIREVVNEARGMPVPVATY